MFGVMLMAVWCGEGMEHIFCVGCRPHRLFCISRAGGAAGGFCFGSSRGILYILLYQVTW